MVEWQEINWGQLTLMTTGGMELLVLEGRYSQREPWGEGQQLIAPPTPPASIHASPTSTETHSLFHLDSLTARLAAPSEHYWVFRPLGAYTSMPAMQIQQKGASSPAYLANNGPRCSVCR